MNKKPFIIAGISIAIAGLGYLIYKSIKTDTTPVTTIPPQPNSNAGDVFAKINWNELLFGKKNERKEKFIEIYCKFLNKKISADDFNLFLYQNKYSPFEIFEFQKEIPCRPIITDRQKKINKLYCDLCREYDDRYKQVEKQIQNLKPTQQEIFIANSIYNTDCNKFQEVKLAKSGLPDIDLKTDDVCYGFNFPVTNSVSYQSGYGWEEDSEGKAFLEKY